MHAWADSFTYFAVGIQKQLSSDDAHRGSSTITASIKAGDNIAALNSTKQYE
jgi:hypothetical protein